MNENEMMQDDEISLFDLFEKFRDGWLAVVEKELLELSNTPAGSAEREGYPVRASLVADFDACPEAGGGFWPPAAVDRDGVLHAATGDPANPGSRGALYCDEAGFAQEGPAARARNHRRPAGRRALGVRLGCLAARKGAAAGSFLKISLCHPPCLAFY